MGTKHLTSEKATAPVTGVAKWIDKDHLQITTANGKSETYGVRVYETEDYFPHYVVLTKTDGTWYDVDVLADQCDCADWTFRRRADGLCKHLKSLKACLSRRPE